MKLDILVLAAHPDDAELSCAGTLMAHIAQGKKVGIVDLTRGELGSRGTPETRAAEAQAASAIMGIEVRENLGFKDGFFVNDQQHQLKVIEVIRKYQPEIVLANAPKDRHPDHSRAAQLSVEACFKSGLRMIETFQEGRPQIAWRPRHVFHFIQSDWLSPDFVVDISDFWEKKVAAISAYATQFYQPGQPQEGVQTFISTPDFMDFIASKARVLGKSVGVEFAEGFIASQPFGVKSLFHLL